MPTIAYLATMSEIFGKPSTKSKILLIVSKHPGFTGKEILTALKKSSRKKLTAQAVYKTLQELAKDQILLKKDKKYSINQAWLKKIKKQVDGLAEALDLIESKNLPSF